MLKYVLTAYQLHQPFDFPNKHCSNHSILSIHKASLHLSINSDSKFLDLLSNYEPVLLELVC